MWERVPFGTATLTEYTNISGNWHAMYMDGWLSQKELLPTYNAWIGQCTGVFFSAGKYCFSSNISVVLKTVIEFNFIKYYRSSD